MGPESEAIERRALIAQHACADEALREALDLRLAKVADGVVSIAGALPASAITENRALGFGRASQIAPDTIAEIVGLYRDSGVQRFFVQLDQQVVTPALEGALQAAGLERARGWQIFSRSLEDDLPEPATAFTVREIDDDHARRFGEIVCAGFDLGDAAVAWLARLPGREGWRAFMAFDGHEPLGAGALFVDREVAWTDFAATAPAHRSRGVQRAVLIHRLHTARAAGCRRIYNCTGEAVPGDPQHSYANILRCGFAEDYLRENWAPPRPA